MLTSIGILIIAKQIPHAVGYDKDEKGNLTELFPFGDEDLHELLRPLQHIDAGVLLICLVSIFIMMVWEKPFIKKRIKFIPGALVAVIVSVIINELFKATQSTLSLSQDHLVQIKAAQSPSEFFSFFTLPDFNGFLDGKVIVTGIMIAIIASLETLLSIEAIDNLDPERNVTNTNRELLAQGIGNSIVGIDWRLTDHQCNCKKQCQCACRGKIQTLNYFSWLPALINSYTHPRIAKHYSFVFPRSHSAFNGI